MRRMLLLYFGSKRKTAPVCTLRSQTDPVQAWRPAQFVLQKLAPGDTYCTYHLFVNLAGERNKLKLEKFQSKLPLGDTS